MKKKQQAAKKKEVDPLRIYRVSSPITAEIVGDRLQLVQAVDVIVLSLAEARQLRDWLNRVLKD